ncbi:MAG: hypothetical protein HY097_04435 [Nitrospinae bacterium]|nr:hypothetical protein [Nitrospinota bacterium]
MNMTQKLSILFGTGLVGLFFGLAATSQESPQIPVYPGAKLVTQTEPGEEPVCCGFTSADPVNKVLSFYTEKLKTKPMDIKTLSEKYPAMRAQFQQLSSQLPPQIKFSAFVLGEMNIGGQKGAMLFEVMAMPQGVSFNIPVESLAEKDKRFAQEWRQRMGKLSDEDIADKETAQRNEEDAAEEKRIQQHQQTQNADRTKRVVATFEKKIVINNVKLFPGSRYAYHYIGGETGNAFMFAYIAPGDFQKVHAFYASQLSGKFGTPGLPPAPIQNMGGQKRAASFPAEGYYWRSTSFDGGCLLLTITEIASVQNGTKQVYVYIDFSGSCIGFDELLRAARN